MSHGHTANNSLYLTCTSGANMILSIILVLFNYARFVGCQGVQGNDQRQQTIACANTYHQGNKTLFAKGYCCSAEVCMCTGMCMCACLCMCMCNNYMYMWVICAHAFASTCRSNQTTKQPNNQTTKQPNKQTQHNTTQHNTTQKRVVTAELKDLVLFSPSFLFQHF